MAKMRASSSFSAVAEERWTVLGRTALVLAIGVVIARAAMMETLRDPFGVMPGATAIPHGAGPTSSLVLDLLACVPALMVLFRRAMDRTFVLRWNWSFLPLGLLGMWSLASTLWAGDKFAAMVRGADFLAAGVLLWGVAQVVREWRDLRLVAAGMVGLVLVLIAHGMLYRMLELPDMRKTWADPKSRADILKRANIEEGSFAAHQFELKWNAGEMMGFNASPNTFAALLEMLGIVTVGLMAQRLANRDGAVWTAAMLGVAALAGYIGFHTRCRTAIPTSAAAIVLLLVAGRMRATLAKYSRQLYWIGLAAVLIGIGMVIAVGLVRGNLIERSLTFRWHYWIGAMKLWITQPLAGVGFANFGEHYLMFRLPSAPEEIKDPHNIFVRFLSELGLVGGVLLIAWLGRMAWEMTRPIQPIAPPERLLEADEVAGQDEAVGLPAAITGIAIALNAACAIDWSQPLSFEIFKRGIFALLLFVGMMLALVRPQTHPVLDERPSPWVLYAMIVALGIFMAHNLIDFSFFETGPMFCFALLCGAVLGARKPSEPASERGGGWGWVMLLMGSAAWLAAVVALVAPTAMAEDAAMQGDDLVRNNRPLEGAGRLEQAASMLAYNGDYSFRAAKALEFARAYPERIAQLYGDAVAANPFVIKYWRERALFEMSLPNPDRQKITMYFKRAIQLDPANTVLRLLFADALKELRMPAEAIQQYELALKYDDLLPQDEIKRMSAEKVARIRKMIEALRSQM